MQILLYLSVRKYLIFIMYTHTHIYSFENILIEITYVKCIRYTSCLLGPRILRTGGDMDLQIAGGKRELEGNSPTT